MERTSPTGVSRDLIDTGARLGESGRNTVHLADTRRNAAYQRQRTSSRTRPNYRPGRKYGVAGIQSLHAFSAWSSSKSGAVLAGGVLALKFNVVCSCPFGCCSRHSSSSKGGMADRTARVRCTLAWHPGQSEIIRFRADLPFAR